MSLLNIAQSYELQPPYSYEYLEINNYKNCNIVVMIEKIDIVDDKINGYDVYNDSNNITHYLVNNRGLRIFNKYYNRIIIFFDVSNIEFNDIDKLSSPIILNNNILYIKQDINYESFKLGSPISQVYYLLNNDSVINISKSICDIIVTI